MSLIRFMIGNGAQLAKSEISPHDVLIPPSSVTFCDTSRAVAM